MANTKSYTVLDKLLDKLKLEEESTLLREHGDWKINSIKYPDGVAYGTSTNQASVSAGNISSSDSGKVLVTVPVPEGTYIVCATAVLEKNASTVYRDAAPRFMIEVFADENTVGTYVEDKSSMHEEAMYNKGLAAGKCHSGTISTVSIIKPKSGFQIKAWNITGATMAASYNYRYTRIA